MPSATQSVPTPVYTKKKEEGAKRRKAHAARSPKKKGIDLSHNAPNEVDPVCWQPSGSESRACCFELPPGTVLTTCLHSFALQPCLICNTGILPEPAILAQNKP